MTRKRRRFTAEFKKRVALEALREHDTVQAIAARYEVHPNQVSAWKRQAVEGLEEVFLGLGIEARRGARGDDPGPAREDRRADGGGARVACVAFFSARVAALSRPERVGMIDRRLRAAAVPAVRTARRESVVPVLRGEGRERGEPGADASCTWSTRSTAAGRWRGICAASAWPPGGTGCGG